MAKKTYIYLGISLWILTVIFAVTPIWPYVFYRLSPGTSDVLAATIGNTIQAKPDLAPPDNVIPAKAGIYTNNLDPRVREDDNPPPFPKITASSSTKLVSAVRSTKVTTGPQSSRPAFGESRTSVLQKTQNNQ